jgi:rubrerythrin
MDLGTTGAILTFALELEKDIGGFYSRALPEVSNANLKQAFGEIQRAQRKRERLLSRMRRENVTEMILEPIHGFDSDAFEIAILSKGPQDDSFLKESAIGIENTLQSFFSRASEKTTFLPEVSNEFMRISDEAGKQAALLKSIEL